jgi:epoxyqueuosine reductase
MTPQCDLAAWIQDLVRRFCDGPENSLHGGEGDPAWRTERAWAEPLLGFSSGADPLYARYKSAVGPFHWTPQEVFDLAFPGMRVRPEELTVICWILPQTPATRADNQQQDRYPAERWARSRIFGEAFNRRLRQHVVDALQEAGYAAASPMLLPEWASVPSERYVFASTWSERHAAYASGLGTFGLCDGLITPRGKAVRVGSAVARIAIPPTPRPYTHHRAYCLFYDAESGEPTGRCGRCIPRCPVGALSEVGHDKATCGRHLHPTTSEYVAAHYGFAGYGCGLCQTGVPCEFKIPAVSDL